MSQKLPDWTQLTDNPCNSEAQSTISHFLESITTIWGKDRTDKLLKLFKDKEVMDIGAGEHSTDLYSESTWEHGLIKKAAKTVLGLDIRPEIVEHYNQKGFNFKCVDATSEEYLGSKFDNVFIGDVVEHVNNPVKLLEFSKRHLRDDGSIILTTPNPFSFSWFFVRLLKRRKLYVGNLDHVFWVSPTNALELGRRAGVILTEVGLSHGNPNPSKSNKVRLLILKLMSFFFSPECTHDEYVYIFKLQKT